jgi:uncharacterized protein (DUF983 family)
MATYPTRPPDLTQQTKPSLSSLLLGLMGDFKLLLSQEVRLARHEIQQEMAKARAAAVSAAVGVSLLAVGGLMLIIMLVHLLQWLTNLPLWGCYGIVAIALLSGGMVLVRKSKGRVSDLHVIPWRTVQTMKENATWMKEQAQSGMR